MDQKTTEPEDKPKPKREKKKPLTLLQRKTKKIDNNLAMITAKAEAFRAKLDAGYVVEITQFAYIPESKN